MFCLLYFSDHPTIFEISPNRSSLLSKMEDKAIQTCVDEVGVKNFVHTLDRDLSKVQFPVYPNFGLKRVSQTEIQVYKFEKGQQIEKGYIFYSVKESIESKLIGTFWVLKVESEEILETLNKNKPLETKKQNPALYHKYDQVILELVNTINHKKIKIE